jgi:hypothetical protein
VIFVVATIVGLIFGAGDQYLGSLSGVAWAASVSLLSAPWLVLPFCFGLTQRAPRKAAVVGFIATFAALIGYGVMTLSPIEGVHVSHQLGLIGALAGSERLVLIGSLITGPLYGWLGQRWRISRSWASASLVAGALCLEPLARAFTGRLSGPGLISGSEVAVGVAAALAFVWMRRRSASSERLSRP